MMCYESDDRCFQVRIVDGYEPESRPWMAYLQVRPVAKVQCLHLVSVQLQLSFFSFLRYYLLEL